MFTSNFVIFNSLLLGKFLCVRPGSLDSGLLIPFQFTFLSERSQYREIQLKLNKFAFLSVFAQIYEENCSKFS